MANPEHLEILAKGVGEWNEWRKENPDVKPDLMGADLNKADLSWAVLSRANLRGAVLSEAVLSEAYLSEAYLFMANLIEANLNRADLSEADLRGADLSEACLSEADLSEANFSGAYLIKANLSGAYLYEANLSEANLSGANLQGTVLIHCCLVGANLTGAKLTGAQLYGTARDGWTIKDIKCRYVYWDASGEQRSPKDRDLEPGQFERLYATLPTIEYIFENGMAPLDPLIMDRVVQAIREKKPEFDIKIDSINARGLVPSIKFTVQQEQHKDPALEAVQKAYEELAKRVEADKERLYDLFALALENIQYKDRLLEQKDRLLAETVGKIGDTITTGPGSVVVSRSSNVSIEQCFSYARDLKKAIVAEPEDSETFVKVAKKTALNILGDALKDFAKGQVKGAAKQIVELGKELGPAIIKTAAYAFFKNCLG